MALRNSPVLRCLAGAWAACSIALAIAPAANAVPLDLATETSVTLDSDTHWWNSPTPKTWGAYQYTVMWDAADGSGVVYPKLVRRRLSDNNLQSVIFNGTGGTADQHLIKINDGHNAVVLGLSPNDGRIHISWTPHNAEHHYGISSAGCLSQANLSGCTFTWSNTGQTSINDVQDGVPAELKATYPYYFNDADGDLYFTYRYATSSENGNQYLNVYDNAGSWTAKGQLLYGRTGSGSFDADGAGPLGTTTRRGPYPDGMHFDKNNRLHMFWMWREGPGSIDHGKYYAYSDDFGTTWRTSAGTAFATINSDPIVVGDVAATQVVSVPAGNFGNRGDVLLDSDNQPHLIFAQSENNTSDAKLASTRLRHVWRDTSGTWFTAWVNPSGTTGNEFAWGTAMVDGSDDIHFIYPHNGLDWSPYNAEPFVEAELTQDHVTWQGGDFLNVVPMSDETALRTTQVPNVPIATGAGNNRKITVRLKNNTAGTSMLFYWTTTASPSWNVAKGQSFSITDNDTTYKTYTFTVTDADWTGTLRDLEVYPAGPGDVSGTNKSVSIDYIRIHNDAGTIAKAWEFQEGGQIKHATALGGNGWNSWSISTLANVNLAIPDAVFLIDTQRYADSGVLSFPFLSQGVPFSESSVIREYKLDNDNCAKTWDFPTDAQGWTVGQHISGFAQSTDGAEKVVGGSLTGADSQILSPTNVKVPIGTNTIHLRLKNTTAATTARVYFTTDADTTWNSTKSVTFAITPNSGYTTYSVPMTGVSGWSGTLRQLRLDPSETAGVTSGSFRLNYLWIQRPAP